MKAEIPDDSLEAKMRQLGEVEAEISMKYRAYKESVKELKKTRESLRNIITAEVLRLKKSIAIGSVCAEYTESVVIHKKKKEQSND